MQLVTNGDESVNIRLFDGDVISVTRSPQVLREQLLAASRTNLSPDYIEVFVSGQVKEPGPQRRLCLGNAYSPRETAEQPETLPLVAGSTL